MNKFKYSILGAFAHLLLVQAAQSACLIKNSDKTLTQAKGDAFYLLLSHLTACPERAQDLKARFLSEGGVVEPSMVGNRGFGNPKLGSFSFFETVSGHLPSIKADVAKGELFFGHFTAATDDHRLILDQIPDQGKLLVELIAWDKSKGLFNFYELIGQGKTAQWFYRGDSVDILHDNAYIYRDPPAGQPKFGKTLRCAACHSSGGPIMKELALPHNDWWTVARPLSFGSNQPSTEIKKWLDQLVDAGTFATNVKNGIHELEESPTYKKARASLSLQEQLRPLFCENEINLESNLAPFDSQSPLHIPSGFFLNQRLASPVVTLDFADYLDFLKTHAMHFPETNAMDADHSWLTPVKSYSDLLAIQSLIDNATVNEAFVVSVLTIEIKTPLFSKDRCSLLKLLPAASPGWQDQFLLNLRASQMPSAQELANYLADPSVMQKLSSQIENFANSLEKLSPTDQDFQKLIHVRQAVFASEISQNPRGQIFEPGFRVIFPEPQNE